MNNQFKFFHTSNSKELATFVAEKLNVSIGAFHSEVFADGEIYSSFNESIRGQTVYILAQCNMPYQNLFEAFITTDAARRAFAKEIILIIPYLPHSRQERKDSERTSIAARVVADFIEQVGADRIITIDLHSSSIEGFFKIPVDHLDASMIFAQHIKELNVSNLCLCSPDLGGMKRVKKYKRVFNTEMVVVYKERLKHNQVSSMEIIGEVKGKNIIIIDDIIDTAGTISKAADLLVEKGAQNVYAYCTHGLLSGEAINTINESKLKAVFITDTVPQRNRGEDKIKVVSCASLLAKAIEKLQVNESIKEYNESFAFV